eukprot:CAMPEP_0115374036 /NCGR_PEP_ID=MMETSP0271-20121206/1745_1 /TAXON_ID=71861 /ORGANISM="Scrippsiella trochoidea, Strain CCMP3099" /LENGTH=150 /DNA_ID=CAMNT_0002797067 /DNA_START=327 /DNA_END=780 /DNA_ORIENTATION=-
MQDAGHRMGCQATAEYVVWATNAIMVSEGMVAAPPPPTALHRLVLLLPSPVALPAMVCAAVASLPGSAVSLLGSVSVAAAATAGEEEEVELLPSPPLPPLPRSGSPAVGAERSKRSNAAAATAAAERSDDEEDAWCTMAAPGSPKNHTVG